MSMGLPFFHLVIHLECGLVNLIILTLSEILVSALAL
jgi:hypothetical protein